MNPSVWLRLGAISGGLAVAAGAFGAHLLEKQLEPRLLQVFETGVRYQLVHALALLAVGLLGIVGRPTRALTTAGWAFFLGSVLFSGSLYTLALTGITKLGAITPFGGVGFLIGWGALAVHRVGPRTASELPREA
jgi:uncharacterized membrane protein YgdD (TMEM256/DUF423 family)